MFVQRKKEAESKDFYNTPAVKRKMFDLDWGRMTAKENVKKKLLGKEEKEVHIPSCT